MNRQAGITRRKFLEAAVGGTAAYVIGASARVLPANSAGPVTRVASVVGVLTFTSKSDLRLVWHIHTIQTAEQFPLRKSAKPFTVDWRPPLGTGYLAYFPQS